MSKVNDFLTEAGVFFLATADGDQPKVRPLGAHFEFDGKVMFGIGDFKDVYKQLLDAMPNLKGIYNETTGHKMMMFHLEDATAVDIPMMGAGENLL